MQRSHQYTSATLFVGILSFVDILSFRAISLEMLTADVEGKSTNNGDLSLYIYSGTPSYPDP